MIDCWTTTFAALGVAVMLVPMPAMSAEWTRDTRSGGQITRSVTRTVTSIPDKRRASDQTVRPTPQIRPAVMVSSTAAGAAIGNRSRWSDLLR